MDRRAKLGVCPSFEHVTRTHNNMAALCVIVSFFFGTTNSHRYRYYTVKLALKVCHVNRMYAATARV